MLLYFHKNMSPEEMEMLKQKGAIEELVNRMKDEQKQEKLNMRGFAQLLKEFRRVK